MQCLRILLGLVEPTEMLLHHSEDGTLDIYSFFREQDVWLPIRCDDSSQHQSKLSLSSFVGEPKIHGLRKTLHNYSISLRPNQWKPLLWQGPEHPWPALRQTEKLLCSDHALSLCLIGQFLPTGPKKALLTMWRHNMLASCFRNSASCRMSLWLSSFSPLQSTAWSASSHWRCS